MSLAAQLGRLLPAIPDDTTDRVRFLRILVLDIETYPALTWQWSLWDKFTPVERIVREGGLLTRAWPNAYTPSCVRPTWWSRTTATGSTCRNCAPT